MQSRAPAQVRERGDSNPASPVENHPKKVKPTTEARLAVESRKPAVARELDMQVDDVEGALDKKAKTTSSLPLE